MVKYIGKATTDAVMTGLAPETHAADTIMKPAKVQLKMFKIDPASTGDDRKRLN